MPRLRWIVRYKKDFHPKMKVLSLYIHFNPVGIVDENVVCVMLLCKLQSGGIVPEHAFHGAILVAETVFDDICILFDIPKVVADIVFAEDQAVIADMFQIGAFKVLLPVKGNVAALDDEILAVLMISRRMGHR